ncbi:MAG: DegT/DnrJ/EryC1/StrS family aminotransferase [Acidobacteriota bacterium]
MGTEVPLVNLQAEHREIAAEVDAGFAKVIARTSFILGPEVAVFEREMAAFAGVEHCIGVASGGDALELMVRAAGVGPGDEVVLPANTFIATALAVARAGARPVLVDCDPEHMLIDVARVRAAIGPRTRAIMPVHLYGQIAPVEELAALAADRGIALLEDAAQAHGARRHGRHAGTLGLCAGLSFYPSKNLGAYGDGGGILTRSDDLARKIRLLRNYGSEVKYVHVAPGFNSRLDTLHAVVLSAKLKRLAGWNEARRIAARRYAELLAGMPGVTLPAAREGNEHVWHLYVVRVADRDRVLDRLQRAGIGAGVHYPIPVHLQEAFRDLGHREGAFPEAERAAREVLSLPMYPHITAAEQEAVASALRDSLA